MLAFLSTVAGAFEIGGRGIVVVPGVLPEGKWKLRVGDPITLERPDGSKLETTIAGIEMGARSREPIKPLLLGRNVTKADVPIGTKLWVAASARAPTAAKA